MMEDEETPPPIPGMRPPLGSPGVVPSPKSSMGFVMPIYTICIIVFFVYTLSKLLFKRATSPYDPVDPDPHFRRRVFRDDSRTSPDKLGKKEADTIVTAISGLVAEVQQQMEASYAQNQQRQDVQDSTRPFTNGTILLNSGPVHIVASEYQEGSKASESNDKEASDPKDATPESRKVVIESTPECDTVPEHTEPVLDHKNSDQEVRESSSEPTFTTDHESSSEEKNTPVHTVDKDTLERNELTSQLKEALVSSQVDADFTPDSKDSIFESDDLAPKLEESPLALDQPISPESTPSVLDNQVHTIELKESDSETEDLIEQSPEVNEPTPDTVTEPKESSSEPEPKESSPKPVSESGESSPEPDPAISKHKESSADSELVIPEPKELSPEPVIPESKELSPEPAICEPEDSPPEPAVPDPKQPSPSPEPIICVPKELSPEPCIPDPKDSSPEPEPIVAGAHEPDETIPIDSIPVEHTEHKESELEKSIPVEESNLDLKEPTPQPKEPTPATEDAKPEDTAKVTKNKQSLNLDDTTEERKETPELKEPANDEPEVKDTLVEVQKQKEPATNDIDDVKDKEKDDLILTDFTDVGKDDSLTKAAEEFLKVERECEKQSTAELLEEALKEGSPKEEEIENAAVKVMGMEVTAHPADGGAWPRELPPAPSPPPARVPHEAPEVKAIYLETEIPQQSRVLVAQFAEDRQADRDSPAKHSPLVVSGKMTLSLIQDAPRDTPERDLESTLDEFTTASAVTQPAAEKEDTDSEEEIEIEFEEEIEEEEEEIEEELPVKPKGGK